MSKQITDRDMLVRTMFALEGSRCCEFFACPGDRHRPVPMASCATASTVWDLRRYLERHGGWCPEHGQDLAECHPRAERPDPDSVAPTHKSHSMLCYCRPVVRDKRGKAIQVA